MRTRAIGKAGIRNAVLGTVALVLLASAGAARAEDSKALAKEYFGPAMKLAQRDPNLPGYCWQAAWSIHHFVKGYLAFQDTEWLDYGVKYFDAVTANLKTGDGGYRGWLVPYSYDANFWCDMHVTDSILVNGLLGFAEVVLKDKALQDKYGAKAKEYVALAEKDFFQKWDARKTWHEDGPYGTYVFWDRYCKANDFGNWMTLPAVRDSGFSLPYNQQNDVAVACLRLFRITGEKKYRDRAAKLFAYQKSRFQFFDGHYCWNYWEPFGPWDFDLAKGETRHWVGTHAYRNYQAGEVGQIVEAYHTGVVFDQADIQRILNTNLKVMWNGSVKDPNYSNSNVTIPGYRRPSFNPSYPTWGGCLWNELADFDATVRDLYAVELRKTVNSRTRIDLAYLQNVTCKEPPSFKRKHAAAPTDVAVFDFPVSECKGLVAAAVMPSAVKRGDKAIVFCKSLASGDLEIALYTADGKTKKVVLYTGPLKGNNDGMSGLMIRQWDGTDPDGKQQFEGPYRVRWTFPGGYREFPITVSK